MVQDSRTRDDGRKWLEMSCCVVGFNMESVVRSPGKWHDQSFIVEISLRLHVASGLQLKHYKGQVTRYEAATVVQVKELWQ